MEEGGRGAALGEGQGCREEGKLACSCLNLCHFDPRVTFAVHAREKARQWRRTACVRGGCGGGLIPKSRHNPYYSYAPALPPPLLLLLLLQL